MKCPLLSVKITSRHNPSKNHEPLSMESKGIVKEALQKSKVLLLDSTGFLKLHGILLVRTLTISHHNALRTNSIHGSSQCKTKKAFKTNVALEKQFPQLTYQFLKQKATPLETPRRICLHTLQLIHDLGCEINYIA